MTVPLERYSQVHAQTFEELGIDLSRLPQKSYAESMRYWFDDDIGSLTNGNGLTGIHDVDASSLKDGIHILHLQIADNEEIWGVPYSSAFMKTSIAEMAPVKELRYWFNDDHSTQKTGNASGGILSVDASMLPDGVHTFHCQVIDGTGISSFVASSIFVKAGAGANLSAKKLLYWFDDESSFSELDMSGGIQTLDASMLLEGLHTLHYQVVCSDGTLTSAHSALFMRMNVDEQSAKVSKLRYWYDDNSDVHEIDAANGLQILDASELMQGLHTFHYQTVDETGAVGIPMSTLFMKIDAEASLSSIKKQRYWFDDDIATLHESDLASGTQTLDASGLCVGLHVLHYQQIDDAGNASVPYNALFMKMAESGYRGKENVITKYMYWTNDLSVNNVKVNIDNPVSSYSLISLLPVVKAPIRSLSFQFEVRDGKPMMFAKNEFHVRFCDSYGYWVDDSRSFIDYSVMQDITDIADLQLSQTFARPEDNAIKWFKFEAEEGDTIAFKASQATSLQVFAPSGEEIYSASGDKSVKYGGAHTWEDGTYYVAVHDVTGTKPNVTLDYMHMDRYDVVAQDVHVVGNGGCSTITFQGNGFRDLYDVELNVKTDDGTNILHPIDINHISDAEVGLTFDFSKVMLKYNPGMIGSGTAEHPIENKSKPYWESAHCSATFHFTEGEKKLSNAITVEEAKDIKLATKVSYPSTFLRGTPVTYTVEITNKGNMTAYAVPIYIWMKSATEGGIFDVRIEGLDLPRLSDYVSSEVLTQSEVAQMKTALDALDNDHYFMKYWVEDEDSPADSVCVRSNYFYTNIAPGETRTVRLKISTREVDAFAYFTLPDEWPSYSIESESPKFMAKARFASAKSESWYCCYRDRIECVANIICNGLDIASLFSVPGPTAVNIASCVAGGMNQVLTAAGDNFCGTNNVEGDFVKKVNNVVKGINIAAALTSCASAFGVKNASEIVAVLDAVTHPSVSINCISAFFSKKPNCPPNPPKGGRSNPVNSLDPNDIHGYLAESGSKFIADSIVTVPYRIEFENDTTFATASAHTVVVTDTLDASKFDLSSYQPTSIKIGDKSVQLQGDKTFVTTVDMRPEIYAIAQVEGMYDEKKGIATWKFTSLDPMTMEETDDVMQGFLPVNFDGRGIGEVAYNINLKPGLADGTEIKNRASIVFDANDPILTPTWTNTIDAVAPTSRVINVLQKNDSIATVYIDGSDNRSGVWKYDVYVQYGEDAPWVKMAECGADSGHIDFRYYDGMDYGFCVVATDSAGNVEKKELTREGSLVKVNLGDVNCDGEVNTLDVSLTTAYYLEQPVYILTMAADVNADGEINTLDATQITQMYLRANVARRGTMRVAPRQRLKTNKTTTTQKQ